MFVVTVEFKLHAEHFDEFIEAVQVQAKNSLELESACHSFDVALAADGSSSVFLYECYSTSSDFDLHLQSQHFRDFDQKVSPWVATKTVAKWQLSEGTP